MSRFCRLILIIAACAGCVSSPGGPGNALRSTAGTTSDAVARQHSTISKSTGAIADATSAENSESSASPFRPIGMESTSPPENSGEESAPEATSIPASSSAAASITDVIQPETPTGQLRSDESPDAGSWRTTAASLPGDTDPVSADSVPPATDAGAPFTENDAESPVAFEQVVNSVYQTYPLLQSALYNRNIAIGQQVGAMGAFDLKLKGASENGPQGFYQTYRQNIGVVQPTYWGGEVFAGYRIGRGDFQPWYLERQTNDSGEFKAGVQVPLARNRDIDARRAELWKAGYGRSLAEPDIQAQLIEYVQQASYAYWDWVAAGENHRIAVRILNLAAERTGRIEEQVKAGLVDPPELTDNLRLVAIREAKVADTRRKLQQTAAKLSVYFRDAAGEPIVASEAQSPGFPEPTPVTNDSLAADIQLALGQRPELRMLDLVRQQTQVDFAEARNQMQPELNAVVWGSQDVGEPTSKKRDKSPYESEASLYLDVPMQRRKARGKMTELQGKLAQISAKRRITADKISVDVQSALAALESAWLQILQTRESLKHAEDLAARERTSQEAGASDLLKVSLREQYAVETAEKNVDALKLYFESRADYRAAMAFDSLNSTPSP